MPVIFSVCVGRPDVVYAPRKLDAFPHNTHHTTPHLIRTTYTYHTRTTQV